MSERMRVITNEEVDARIAELEEQLPAPGHEFALVKSGELVAAEVDHRLEANIDTIDASSNPEQHEQWKKMTMSKTSGYDQTILRLTLF